MGFLGRFEKKVEGAVSGVFARAFKGDVQPVEIAARLQRELDTEAKLMSRDKRLVPNEFVVSLSAHDHDKLVPYSATLTTELASELRRHAGEMGYVFNGPIRIHFELDEAPPRRPVHGDQRGGCRGRVESAMVRSAQRLPQRLPERHGSGRRPQSGRVARIRQTSSSPDLLSRRTNDPTCCRTRRPRRTSAPTIPTPSRSRSSARRPPPSRLLGWPRSPDRTAASWCSR